MAGFRKINFSGPAGQVEAAQSRLRALTQERAKTIGGFTAEAAAGDSPLARPLPSHETAGRVYLQTYLEDAEDEKLAELTSPLSPALVPDMILVRTSNAQQLIARSLVFQQTWQGVPIFGGGISVDVDESNRSLVAINGQLATAPGLTPVAERSPSNARAALEKWAAGGTVPGDIIPKLVWYFDPGREKWHLTWHFHDVPLTPPDASGDDAGGDNQGQEVHEGLAPAGHLHSRYCLGPSPRSRLLHIDALVDAVTADVVYFFPTSPALQVPVEMSGEDTDGRRCNFFGLQTPAGFALTDPLRNIATYDFGGGDIDANANPPLPPAPVSHGARDLANTNPAAVSAHHNSTKVFDFFNDVLKRDGVDDKGMQLVSVVNVWSSQGGAPYPEWPNAVWWQNRMWYGVQGNRSFATYLDIIAHELTHGVTESSAGLVYRDLPGALNESFSDIFGVIIANWFPNMPEPISSWNWQIGKGLGRGGGPIRDMSNPASLGQPDHFSNYVPLPYRQDYGGVHLYSGIHNLAVYLLLTDTDASGTNTFPVRDAALLLYLTLVRLNQTSDFADSRRTLESVTSAYYGDPGIRQARLSAIARAFGAVGL